MTNAVESLGKEGLSKEDILPALVDFVTAFGLIAGKEPGARAIITRIDGRIEDWKAGRFPGPTASPESRKSHRRRGASFLHLIYAPEKPLWIKGFFDEHES
jgi:hypothetical protein